MLHSLLIAEGYTSLFPSDPQGLLLLFRLENGTDNWPVYKIIRDASAPKVNKTELNISAAGRAPTTTATRGPTRRSRRRTPRRTSRSAWTTYNVTSVLGDKGAPEDTAHAHFNSTHVVDVAETGVR
jgi:hypothetical protein